MYEELTDFIPKLTEIKYGEMIIDIKGDGTPENPRQFPWVKYEDNVEKFMDSIYSFVDKNQEGFYRDILENAGIRWNIDSMDSANVAYLDGKTVVALILAAIRAERFCDGALLHFLEKGKILEWLTRLKEIDEGK